MEVKVELFYSNRELYPFMPSNVFDALEAAYLSGSETATIPEEDYNKMMDAKNKALCPVM